MRLAVAACLSVLALIASTAAAADGAARTFELRIYTTEEGKLEALHERFREHTIALFEKHGMDVIGFWTPLDEETAENTLVYLLAYPSPEARAASWKAFGSDPEWRRVFEASRVDGPLVQKVESRMMKPTDFSALE